MARLVYTDKAGFEQVVTIDKNSSTVTIGRHPDCVIQTTNASVSRRHCIIEPTPRGYELSDQNSSSGTYINQQRITSHMLEDGEQIHCGSFMLSFHADPEPEPVMVRGRLVYYDDQGIERSATIGEEHRRVTVGRSAECTVRTADTSVSRLHSEFLFSNGRVEVIDLESFNGSYVNNEKVSRQLLQPNDQVSCGRLTFAFYVDEERIPGAPAMGSVPPPVSSAPPPTMPPPPRGDNGRSASNFARTPSASQSAAYQSAPPPIAPSIPSEALVRAEAERDALRQEIETLRVELQGLRQRNDDLRRDADEARNQHHDVNDRIREVERDLRHKQVDADALREKCTDLKEQCDRYLEQLDQKRVELQQKREENERLNYKFAEIQAQHDRGTGQVALYIEENAELKAEITQLQRKTEEYKRQAESQEYDLKRSQQELDDMRRMVNNEGQSNNNLQDDIGKLRLVLEEKEEALHNRDEEIANLRADIEGLKELGQSDLEIDRVRGELEYQKEQTRELEQELARAQEKLSNSTSSEELDDMRAQLRDVLKENQALQQANAAQDSQDNKDEQSRVNDLKRERRDLKHKIEELEAKLEQAPAGNQATAGSELAKDNAHLKRQLEDARHELERARRDASGGQDTERLEQDKRKLQRELDELRSRPAPGGGGGDAEALRAKAQESYDAINDPVSQMRNDLQTCEDFARDLQRLNDAYKKIDPQSLSALDRVRVEDTRREVDPDYAFEELMTLLRSSCENTEQMKDALRSFRRNVLR